MRPVNGAGDLSRAHQATEIGASCWPFRAASSRAATSAAGVAMDVVHMHFEVVVPGELLVAELALCQRAIGVVSHLVSDQHFLQAKSQVTHVTLERLLPRVRPPVLVQAALLAEGLAAVGALVRLLPGVGPDVHFQSVVFAEPFVTVRALVRTLTCVAPDVNSQGPAAGKLLTTVWADFFLFSRVCFLMTSKH